MFTLLTLNDWSSIFYVNYLGCNVFQSKKAQQRAQQIARKRAKLLAAEQAATATAGAVSSDDPRSLKGRASLWQSGRNLLSKTGLVADQEDHPDAHKSVNEINTQRLLKATLLTVFTGKKVTFEKMKERTDIRRRIVAAGDLCEKVYDHHLFKTWMVISVLASGIIVLLATYPDVNKDPSMDPLKQSIEVFTLVAFTFEFVITITMFKTGVLCIRMAQSQQRTNYLCVISR